ncbi:AAA family ATPase [Pseudanabaena sp. Chao 1811]|uniref:AAA family ATPase n=1 Tax=Pseudanabaena sp. Chao 1811 TaxID=2963092 RepID=UPI0022F38D28|nr:AAA family ATPase [Pseudanabaena sp. Chao 1811]
MLKHISIKGFKSIKELELDLSPINVLIGANGSGKSNFISFFKLLNRMMQSQGELQLFVAQSGGANSFLFDGAEITLQIESELEFEVSKDKFDYAFKNDRFDYSFKLSYAASDTFVFAEEKCRDFNIMYNVWSDWMTLLSGHRESKLLEFTMFAQKKIYSLIRNFIVYQFHNTSTTSRIKQKWNADDNQYLKEDAGNLAPFLLRIRSKEPRYYQRIIETVSQISPFFADFVLNPTSKTVLLQWREKGTDLIFSPHQASDGTLRVMALVTLLLQPPDSLPDVLILDEPELGLHPYAINIIGSLINSVANRCQVILATQSPLLVDCFEPEDIIVVERNERESTFKRLVETDLEDWLEEYSLSELWNKNVIGGRPSR